MRELDEAARPLIARLVLAEQLILTPEELGHLADWYGGLRRAEIKRLDWPDVELDGYRLVVQKAKSRAGTGRRPPIAERGRARWAAAALEPITLHECRHTYASFLMAAGYTLRELMEHMGHSSLEATEHYVKLLPPLDETDPAERLNAYLRRRAQ
jgi:integrase